MSGAAPRQDEDNSPYVIAAPPTQRPRVLKQGDAFAVLDDYGNAQPASAHGLYFEDTRYLNQLQLTVNGHLPLLLSSFVTEENGALIADLTNPDFTTEDGVVLAKDLVHILATTVLGNGTLFRTLTLHNFSHFRARLRLELSFGSDFADIFEVRGTPRAKRGAMLPDTSVSDGTEMAYRGLDGIRRSTRFTFDPAPDMAPGRRAVWQMALEPGETRTIEIAIRCARDGRPASTTDRHACVAAAAKHHEQRRSEVTQIFTSNESFNDWVNRSRADLEMLITETPQGLYAYAGIPWFSTAFGRDGIITALQCLWLDPKLAAGTLRFLAARQAKEVDPRADAEPGKILHETRLGEMSGLGEVPFGLYYGGVDSTPLFVVLAAGYWRRTGDLGLIREIWPAIEAALNWMVEYGDRSHDGFLSYDRQSPNGLTNQGWKDSSDSVFHANGKLAEAPIALAEVQAYAYAAYHGAAELAAALGESDRAEDLEEAAERLQQRFEAAFWLDDMGTYAIALDGAKQPCRVATSNAGHVLLGGLASPERAARVAARLTGRPSFSRWGIRTVEEGSARYNPMSYHNGSVWPHDNALIGMGFARYGLREPLQRVLTALFDASLFLSDRRLPELFCGFERRPGSSPTGYPVACLPQAWSSATVFGLLGALLGISFEPAAQQVRFTRPALPSWMDECRISALRVGEAELDLQLIRHGADVALHVLRRSGPVEVAIIN